MRPSTPGNPVISLVWSRSQQYISVVWLSWRSAVLVTDPVQDTLWKAVRVRLAQVTEDLVPPSPSAAELAMLGPADLPSGAAGPNPDDPVKNMTADPAANGGIEITNAESMSVPDVGDAASGWQYDRQWPGGERDHVYVALFWNGPFVAQVVRMVQDTDPAQAAVAQLVTVAAERLSLHADELATTGLRPH